MSNISALRHLVNTDFLSNNKISGAEANKLIKEATSTGTAEQAQGALLTLREEFKDRFTTAGLRDFDKRFERTFDTDVATAGAAAGGGVSPLSLRGADLSHLPTAFKLSEVRDPDVRRMLRSLDLNIDGKVDTKDKDKLGLSDSQWQMFMFTALLTGKKIDEGDVFPQDLTGKKIVFSGVDDKAEAKKWAEAMGATVVSDVGPDVDFLVVGRDGQTGKDERAHAMNVLGQSDITVGRMGRFSQTALAAGAITRTVTTDPADAQARITAYLSTWYEEYVRDGYEDDLAGVSGGERASLLADLQEDLDNGFMVDAPDDHIVDWIDDNYDRNGPYRDAAGNAVPVDDLEIMRLDMMTNLAGIGLSKHFVFDRRTGELMDDFDIQD